MLVFNSLVWDGDHRIALAFSQLKHLPGPVPSIYYMYTAEHPGMRIIMCCPFIIVAAF